MINIGLCGYGYWGPNLLRVFSNNPGFTVVAVAEPRAERLAKTPPAAGRIALFEQSEKMIDDPSVQAVVIATPVATHFALVARALRLGKHVLVEKPMCASVEEARELVAIAVRGGA